jgi:hypothetical protein
MSKIKAESYTFNFKNIPKAKDITAMAAKDRAANLDSLRKSGIRSKKEATRKVINNKRTKFWS